MKSIFVSSTFRDMHFERDILNREIGPKLNYILSKYNKSIRISDLRWGVDTTDLSEKGASERVLSVCFDEINKCKPYIIILLGDRYGYIPDDGGLSVTHMEIIRGAFENAETDHIFIYFRDADYTCMPEETRSVFLEQDAAAKGKLDALKEELFRRLPERCRTYRAHWSEEDARMVSDEFTDLVYRDLEAEFTREFAGAAYQSPLQQQRSENEELLCENLQSVYKNDADLMAAAEAVVTADKPYGIIGDAGEGKSVYMSLLCSTLRERGCRAEILFCGDNAFSASIRNAAEYVLYTLVSSSGEEYDFEGCSAFEYEELLAKILSQRTSVKEKSYLFLDAVDKCDEGMVNFILWCGRYLSGQLQVVFSSRAIREINGLEHSLILRDIKHDRAELRLMAECLLGKYRKALNEDLIELLTEKASTPLQLSIILQRLLNLNAADYESINQNGGGIGAINAYLRSLIEKDAKDITAMIGSLLNSLLESSSNVQFALGLIGLLASSECGLPEYDLKDLCGLLDIQWVQLDYVDFLAKFAFFIRVRDSGRLDLSHDVFRQAFREAQEEQIRPAYSRMAMYYLNYKTQNSFTIRTFFHSAYHGRQSRRLVEFLVNHHGLFDVWKQGASSLGKEMRACMLQTFLLDNGAFVMGSAQKCRDLEELMLFQNALSTALFSASEFLPKEVILYLASAIMQLPLTVETFPSETAELELFSCERLLRRCSITGEDAEKFLSDCRREIDAKKGGEPDTGKNGKSEDPVERMFEIICSPDAAVSEKAMCLYNLLDLCRDMASDATQAEKSEALLMRLLDCDAAGVMEEEKPISLADIYTALGAVYKAQRKWTDAIKYDQMSLEIYRGLYEKYPNPVIFRKYRARVYNIVNVMEAQAIQEGADQNLWQQIRDQYAEAYRLDAIAIGQGVSDQELLECASAIMSYGTAMINTGDHDGGFQKYKEGIALILDLAENHPRHELYLKICNHLMECFYLLSTCRRYDEAVEIFSDIYKYLTEVIESGQNELSKEALSDVRNFSNRIYGILAELFRENNVDDSLKLLRVLSKLYQIILPIAPYGFKAAAMRTQRNIGDILFSRKADYRRAFEEYQELFRLVREYDLAGPNDSGRFNDQVNLRMGEAYLRMFICLHRLGELEPLKKMVKEAPEDAKYLAEHTEAYHDDPAAFLYITGMKLAEEHRSLGIAVLTQAFHVTRSETYDQKGHANTVAKILMAIQHLSGASEANDRSVHSDE